ncbi:MAG: hypothetical protein ACI8P3_002611 [Saprospiraceae bacterium]|jgi:hypothetical protein
MTAIKRSTVIIDAYQMKHLKFEIINDEHVVTLRDTEGYEVIKGYGVTVIEAINDLHSNLI